MVNSVRNSSLFITAVLSVGCATNSSSLSGMSVNDQIAALSVTSQPRADLQEDTVYSVEFTLSTSSLLLDSKLQTWLEAYRESSIEVTFSVVNDAAKLETFLHAAQLSDELQTRVQDSTIWVITYDALVNKNSFVFWANQSLEAL